MKRLPRVQKRDAVTTGKAVRNTNVKSVICFLGVPKVKAVNLPKTKIEPRKRSIIETRFKCLLGALRLLSLPAVRTEKAFHKVFVIRA